MIKIQSYEFELRVVKSTNKINSINPCYLGVIHYWRHGLMGGRVFKWFCYGDGRKGVRNCPKLRDIIYGQPLFTSWTENNQVIDYQFKKRDIILLFNIFKFHQRTFSDDDSSDQVFKEQNRVPRSGKQSRLKNLGGPSDSRLGPIN